RRPLGALVRAVRDRPRRGDGRRRPRRRDRRRRDARHGRRRPHRAAGPPTRPAGDRRGGPPPPRRPRAAGGPRAEGRPPRPPAVRVGAGRRRHAGGLRRAAPPVADHRREGSCGPWSSGGSRVGGGRVMSTAPDLVPAATPLAARPAVARAWARRHVTALRAALSTLEDAAPQLDRLAT